MVKYSRPTRRPYRRPARKSKVVTYKGLRKFIARRTETSIINYDSGGTAIHPVTTSAFKALTGITQGDDDGDRHGNQIFLKGFYGTYEILNTTANPKYIRVMLVMWNTQVTGIPPLLADVLEDSTNYPWMSPTKFVNRKLMNVIYDKKHMFVRATANEKRFGRVSKKYRSKQLYNSPNANGYVGWTPFMLFLSDTATATDIDVLHNIRIYYTDS